MIDPFLRYRTRLRPDSLPLLPESMLTGVFRRMETRLSSFKAEESMMTITGDFAAHVYALHVDKEIQKKLTGDRTKLLMLAAPFILRDLAYHEVFLVSPR